MYKHGENLRILDEGSVFIDERAVIGRGVTIYENNRIEGSTIIGDGAVLLPGTYIKDSVIGEYTTFNSSQAESARIGNRVYVGPYARLRPGADICDGAKIGNFVEVKNSKIGEGTKVSHLAYVGDADVGRECNIGCGAIFVNYNGREKHRSVVGDGAFIGSNCNIIAPVSIADGAYVAAGTTVSADVPADDFVIGRVRQEHKRGRAHEYLRREK